MYIIHLHKQRSHVVYEWLILYLYTRAVFTILLVTQSIDPLPRAWAPAVQCILGVGWGGCLTSNSCTVPGVNAGTKCMRAPVYPIWAGMGHVYPDHHGSACCGYRRKISVSLPLATISLQIIFFNCLKNGSWTLPPSCLPPKQRL